jgi:hypothetical protein
METKTTMSRKKETLMHRKPVKAADAAQELLEAAWLHCGMIQDIIDGLNEAGSSTELRLLRNRLHRLAFRAAPRRSFENRHPTDLVVW